MKNNGKKKTIVLVIVLFLIALFLLYYFKFRGSKKETYTTDAVKIMDVSSSVTIKGTVQGDGEDEVYSDSANKILSIPVEVGDMVKKGQVLATLDTEKLQQQYDIARIDYESAKKNYDNMTELFKSGSVPQASVDEAKWALDKAELLCKTYDIENAGEIVSPIDGTVSQINCTEGGYATFTVIQKPAFVIEDRSKLVLKAEAKEKYRKSIFVGQEAEITAETMGNLKVKGKVTEIASSGEINQGTGAVVIPVTIEINDNPDDWMTGVSAKARLVLTEKEVLTVSIDAVSEKNDEICVYVLENDQSIKRVIIETGINDGERIQVVSGDISEDDNVIIDPDAYIFE